MRVSATLPTAVRLVERYDDGLDACHFRFEAIEAGSVGAAEPGQFFMLTLPGVGEAAFTYVTSPDAGGRFDALMRRVGSLTRALFELEAGAVLGVRGPFGHGWPTDALAEGRTLVLAGGCGLAPLCSALEALAGAAHAAGVLVYGARSEAHQVLARERAGWHGRLPVIETFDHPAKPESPRGTPLAHLAEAIAQLGGPPDRALICGPEIMMQRSASALLDRGLAADRIWLSLERRMHCGTGLCGHCYVGPSYVCTDGPTYRLDALRALHALSPQRSSLATEIHHC